ncbi:hypothetical protein RMS29_027730 (plasmid) [Agrobacterium rosae]|uniref:Uncharacterized protein n=1 Tax=Agrobacterium rosae TaxID=1972867 RepID=A0AAW9FH58_9HYPH|nr:MULTISPECIES: hypothetical protein [Agrobacterium]MCF1501538.1 hypothetical protein [Allorhizobium sp. Av2]MDX8321744.1 hypothetical protein [Agrobacterium sp. rho-8.1]MDX8305210.1 hypothetical protein [Agrobacterium rosae]MDX8311491.1 hypothetical protein [Agrobacterium sp. rho-13.3]MDX8316275.1 hypothetical protein [Agrobacterium rosae]
MGFFQDFVQNLQRTPTENHAAIEKMHPGYLARLEAQRKRDAALANFASGNRNTGFGGSMSDTSNPAVMAHQMAMRGALDPNVAFSLGVPGAPTGTGKMRGPGSYYEG